MYWRLSKDAGMRELLLAVRADEACHSHVNHVFSGLDDCDRNPFARGRNQAGCLITLGNSNILHAGDRRCCQWCCQALLLLTMQAREPEDTDSCNIK